VKKDQPETSPSEQMQLRAALQEQQQAEQRLQRLKAQRKNSRSRGDIELAEKDARDKRRHAEELREAILKKNQTTG